ncbi:hypothetical protein P4U03_30345 [Bacillus mycoides]|uniref:Carboxymuconolactone decarboxylase n=1 Tax=Bacillus thuringiensis serovar navarrensis TaxID=339658 RepID=A0A243AN66_BACTU|nr:MULTISPECIES: carboxymuconolactone decarboxylase [Bacillus]MBK5360432.1 hypothetical protein [Bacillus sp. TH44]MBE7105786.1 carboxymuconolactone decarboxylase family protein [Bacillus cereus]MBE7122146.1 carboxymuconolactone decarboxylase family protein [Bacillus cereus]MBK5345630.1 hypothetical protein [Bacillus sp. TH45]MBK5367327.1 hypothetical protein [Bacillus sp. TH50]
MNMNDINQIYQNLFGFIPAPTEARHEVTLQVRPEELELHEMFRKNSMESKYIPEKYVQIMLFGMLLMLAAPGAKVHLIASRRAGASWDELFDVAKLAFLFKGLSAFNFGMSLIKEVMESEKNNN